MEVSLVLLFLLAGVSGFPKVWKVWVPNTNYDNPANWVQGYPPRSVDRAVFPVDLDLGVTLPKGITVLRQLVLPVNGEVFLPSAGALTITGGLQAGEDVTWKRRGVSAWLDPNNWRSDADGVTAPVPHMERLPCSADTVVFPANSSFRVRLPEVAVPVGSVQLGGVELTGAEWLAWLNTEAGYRQFIGREEDRATAVSVKELPMCPERSGCVCGQPVSRSPARLLEEVCNYARVSCAEEVLCYSPIRPEGHCCDICGGFLTLEIKTPDFDLDSVRERMNHFLSSGDFPGVSGHVGRTSGEHAQIVLVDRSGRYEEDSVRLAGVLKDDIINSKLVGVLSVTVHTSGARVLGSRWVAATSTLFGTLFAVVLFMGIAYLLFVAHPTGFRFRQGVVPNPFRFARFENLGGEGEGALQLGCEALPGDDASIRQSFDNPLYGQSKDEVQPEAAEGTDRSATLENPVYSELVLQEKSKKKEEEEEVLVDEEEDENDEDSDTETDPEDQGKFDEIKFGES